MENIRVRLAEIERLHFVTIKYCGFRLVFLLRILEMNLSIRFQGIQINGKSFQARID